ncbi:MAG: M48 family metallopeptidase [Bacteroidia bacterium]
MTSFILFGSKQINFRLEYSNRKSLGITVMPDLEVFVKAPVNTSLEKVKEKIRKKAPWIIKQQGFFLSFYPKTQLRKYISGETHFYMGRQYRLKVVSSKSNAVAYKGRYIEVLTKSKTKTKELVKHWYRQKAKEKFADIAEPLIQQFKKYGVEPAGIYIQEMKQRWGSCTPNGKIILNTELIKAPKSCIEYVIIHELCHLVHRNHTQKFIDLQTKEMPDWEKWKTRLEHLLA